MEGKISSIITEQYAKEKNVYTLKADEKEITVQMAEYNISVVKELKSMSQREIKVKLADAEEIRENIKKMYSYEKKSGLEENGGNRYELYVDELINEAIEKSSSDIHIEPFEKYIRIRYRINGDLKNVNICTKELYSKISSIIKLKSNCDITEKRIPQDGRFTFKFRGEEIDIRLSTIPTYYGEKLEMRILDKNKYIKNLEELGFSKKAVECIGQIIDDKKGMLVVTGPTGSGKSSTVYSILNGIKESEENITTIEDPVECRIEGINQIQVNEKAKLKFGNGLKAILRQDPDIISVGEIRDAETAQIAIRAAMTGHFVITTLHTEDAISTISRLRDIGIEPYKINSAISGIISQKLVKINSIAPSYKGGERCLLYEVLKLNDEIKKSISNNEEKIKIKEMAIKSGMITFEDSLKTQKNKYSK